MKSSTKISRKIRALLPEMVLVFQDIVLWFPNISTEWIIESTFFFSNPMVIDLFLLQNFFVEFQFLRLFFIIFLIFKLKSLRIKFRSIIENKTLKKWILFNRISLNIHIYSASFVQRVSCKEEIGRVKFCIESFVVIR